MSASAWARLPPLLRLLLATVFFARAAYTQTDILTANGSNDRNNSNLQETRLSRATVDPASFGKLGTFPVDGQVYSQPLIVSGLEIPGIGTRNVVLVSTMRNSVYAFDADAMSPVRVLWQVTLGTPVPSQLLYGPYGDISPDVGILSTGVVDRNRGVLYVVAEVMQGGRPAFYLHALDLASGAERLNGPVAISGSATGSGSGSRPDGTIAFDAMQQIQRPALLLANDSVYVGFGSHGDQGLYHGWMFTYDAADLRNAAGTYVSTPDGNGGAIWQSGRGPAADGQGNVYVVNANGDYDGVRNFGQSFVKLNAAGTATLDSYTPVDWKEMSDNDFDLSAGPALIRGTQTFLGADKLGNLYAIDSGGMNRPGSTSVVTASEASIFNFAVWSSGSAARVYTQGGGEPVKCFLVTPEGINPVPLYTAASPIPFARIGLTISANGDVPDSGILWETAGNYNQAGAPGILIAYDASNLELLWTSDMNPDRDRLPPAIKFAPPTVANGKVYVPSSANAVTVYGSYAPPTDEGVPAPEIVTVANAASYSKGAVSPGELVAIFGSGFDTSGSVEVLFDGVASPTIFAGTSQVNAVVPSGVAAPATLVQVQCAGWASVPFSVNVANAAIGMFSADSSGSGQAAASNEDGGINSQTHPAAPGSLVTVWATGAGQLEPDGARPAAPMTAYIDGHAAEVLYAGEGPGLVPGVIQVNLRIPAGAMAGAAPVVLRVGDSESQSGVTLALSP